MMEISPKEIENTITEVLTEMIEMYELPPTPITPDLLLIETLGFSSIDIMHMLASVDMRFQKHLPYDKMVLKNGEYITDLSIQNVVDFIYENFENASTEPIKMS